MILGARLAIIASVGFANHRKTSVRLMATVPRINAVLLKKTAKGEEFVRVCANRETGAHLR